MIRSVLLAGCGLLAWATPSQATVMPAASLFSTPFASGTLTAIDLPNVSAPSQAPVSGAGYSITFATGAGQGVVRGSSGTAALPVAGVSGGAPTYLTGGYGSAQTGNAAQAGSYLSTGTGSITVTFAAVQRSLALLWGSVDAYNAVTFLDANGNAVDTLTGSTVQALANGFAGNGFQGAGGSAYVTATETAGFSGVRFDSLSPSFELAGLAATTGVFYIPEPLSLTLFASGLAMAGLVRHRRRG